MSTKINVNGGHTTLSGSVDAEGNREYRIKYRVESDDPGDGPAIVRATPGLPTIGSSWQTDNDSDPWAFCLPTCTIQQAEEGELYWDVELVFSSKAVPPGQQRCNDSRIEDPLLEPPKLSGGSTKYSEEATYDRFGNPICSSSFEPIRGQVNEWDANRSSIKIDMNVLSFFQVQLALAMRDTVNILPLWGFDRRCVKLSNVTWERKFYGLCYAYYTLHMEFDTNERTFDREILDEGHSALKGHFDSATGYYVLDKIPGGQGSGATADITAVAGVITAVATTPAAGGTGYRRSSTFGLDVTGGGGTRGTVSATTNASGVVTSFAALPIDGGTGYVTTPGAATRTSRYPSRFNPSDFVRINDREGNPAKMVLNGFGLPAGATVRMQLTDGTPAEYGLAATRYIRGRDPDGADILPPPMVAGSGANTYAGARSWMEVRNFANWTSLVPPGWTGELRYIAGDVIIAGTASGNVAYICLSANIADPPPSANWLQVPLLANIVDRSPWVDGTTDYIIGNIVRMETTTDPVGAGYYTFQTSIGRLHVERYNESYFPALGIPAII